MERTFRFVFQSGEDATVCYSVLNRLIDKLEDFYKNCKDLSSIEFHLQEGEDPSADKTAYFQLHTGTQRISEFSKSPLWEDALLNVFDKVKARFKEPEIPDEAIQRSNS